MKRAAIRRWQRIAGILLAVATVCLLANSAFLVTALTPQGLVPLMQRLHLILGVGLLVALPIFVGSHVVLHRRHRNGGARKVGVLVATVASVGSLAGLGLWVLGKSSALKWLVILHEAAFGAALLTYVLHRLRAFATPALRAEILAGGAAVVLAGGIYAGQQWWPRTTDASGPPRAAFNPGLSQARTVDGHVLGPEDLANPEYCAQCHPAIAERWERSTHHFGSLNDPFYAATLAFAQKHRDADQLKFCGGCHDPLLLLTGRMDAHPKPEDPGADAGITCLVCHAITEPPSLIGNGSYVVAAPEHYPGYDSPDADERERSNRLIRSKPEQHIASFSKEHLRTPQMCMPCHKAHIPPELNGHRWLRGQNEYDPWHDSGAGGNSARTFYAPGKKQKRCQDCHMPRIAADDPAARDGTVSDHAFLGANTALPHALGDDQWLARNRAFVKDVLSLDVGAIEVKTDAGMQRQLAPPATVTLPAGQPVTVDVVVRNQGSGHLFPGGIADLRQSWLEVTLRREDGTALLASGWLDDGGVLDPNSHRWNAVLLDGEGKPLLVHDVEDAHVVLTARRIMLGASDIVRLAFDAPDQATTLEIRVLDRKFPRDYVEFALGADASAIPVTEIAATSIQLQPGDFVPTVPASDAGPRLRNLGIGHLLHGDTALAEQAAIAAAERMPKDPGPWLDQARAALEDGSLKRAEELVREADSRSPGHATAAWLLARIRSAQGNHEASITALDVAIASFPRDRQLLVMKADALFKLEREEPAAELLEQVLTIDPENLAAHALLTRIESERGNEAGSKEHRALWDRVRPHSEDQALTERARRDDPALDRRANMQYLLPLQAPPESWVRADAK